MTPLFHSVENPPQSLPLRSLWLAGSPGCTGRYRARVRPSPFGLGLGTRLFSIAWKNRQKFFHCVELFGPIFPQCGKIPAKLFHCVEKSLKLFPLCGKNGPNFSTAWNFFAHFFHSVENIFPHCGKSERRNNVRCAQHCERRISCGFWRGSRAKISGGFSDDGAPPQGGGGVRVQRSEVRHQPQTKSPNAVETVQPEISNIEPCPSFVCRAQHMAAP